MSTLVEKLRSSRRKPNPSSTEILLFQKPDRFKQFEYRGGALTLREVPLRSWPTLTLLAYSEPFEASCISSNETPVDSSCTMPMMPSGVMIGEPKTVESTLPPSRIRP